ncbi:SusC/RagA family TonB-linked outer membrane protein [Flagellimonas sp.]|uniref:SusC/RagA family TonB-linked outer membrane protein n=1 Tax=Flagellimonas sp. TaxID=2058762 RepID=UPI003B51105A
MEIKLINVRSFGGKRLLKMIMKTFIFLMCTTVFCLNTKNSFSQVKIIITKDQLVSVDNVFKIIQKQTDYNFVYPRKVFKDAPKVQLNKGEIGLTELLEKSLYNSNFRFELAEDNNILIWKNAIVNDNTKQQGIAINGTVTDEFGEPLPGTNIVEKGTTNGTQTDFDGNFSINVIDESAVLVVSYLGFTTQEVTINDRTTINVILKESTAGLDEVVVIGYGETVRKKDLTGAVASADLDRVSEFPTASIAQALQGRIEGLNVGAVNQAGQNPVLSVRGQNTISSGTGDNAPLIVVDGIIYRGSLIDLNSADIGSINVLKDASSAAIYGSQASNGVILITTKNGRSSDAGKPTINYSSSYSVQVPSNNLKPMRGEELEAFLLDAHWLNSKLAPDYIQPNPDFSLIPFFRTAQIADNYENGIENDWWGALTRDGYTHVQNISISGNNDAVDYFVSGGLTDVAGFRLNEKYRKYNYRVNLNAKINPWLHLGLNSFVTTSDYSGVEPSLTDSFVLYPWAPIYSSDGEFELFPDNRGLNPFLVAQQDDSDKRLNIFANIHTDIKLPFLPGFNYRLNFSQDYRTTNQDRFNPYGANLTGSGYKNSFISYDWTLDNIISYEKRFKDDHKINLTLLYGVEKRQISSTEASAENFVNKNLGFNSLEAGDPTLNIIDTGKEQETSLYSMFRLLYNYKSRYLLTGTIRRDGFSGFGEKEKIGVFPSIALAWIISEENFMRGINSKFNLLKLRGSYGQTGRRGIGRYDTQAVVSSQPSVVFGDGGNAVIGQWISSLSNIDLGWETTTGLNLGLDFAVFDSRLNGNIEYYNNDTEDILYPIQLPTLTGFNTISANIGKVHNWGIEVGLNARIVDSESFKWDSSINYSRNRNKIVSVLGPQNDQDGDGQEDDLISNNLFIGEPQNVNYNYEVIGLWQLTDTDIPNGFLPGTYKLADINEDGVINADDRKILGYQDPSYRMGFTNTFSYKNLSLHTFVNTIQGGKNYYQANLGLPNGSSWAKLDQLIYSTPPQGGWDYWTPTNTDAKFRRLDTPSQLGQNTGPHGQRNFVRLQDVSLAYSFDKKLASKIGVNNLKLFISGKNLATWTKWDGWDPEAGVGFQVGRPVMASYTLGVNVEF